MLVRSPVIPRQTANNIVAPEFPCPACGRSRQHEFLWQKNNYNVYRCKTCGVGRVDAQDFRAEDFYNAGYFLGECADGYVDYKGSEPVIRRDFRKTVRFIRKLGPERGTLLEIGCAYGFFLQEAKAYYHVLGVEMSRDAVNHCHETGLHDVYCGADFQDFVRAHGPIDVVVMLDVIEHLADVEGTLRLLSEQIRVGGLLLVTTGDWNSLVARLTGPSWRLMSPPGHLWYFTRETLEALLQKMGFALINASHPWKFVPLDLILRQGAAMLGLKTPPRVPLLLKPLGLPANLFDAMRLAFRKTK